MHERSHGLAGHGPSGMKPAIGETGSDVVVGHPDDVVMKRRRVRYIRERRRRKRTGDADGHQGGDHYRHECGQPHTVTPVPQFRSHCSPLAARSGTLHPLGCPAPQHHSCTTGTDRGCPVRRSRTGGAGREERPAGNDPDGDRRGVGGHTQAGVRRFCHARYDPSTDNGSLETTRPAVSAAGHARQVRRCQPGRPPRRRHRRKRRVGGSRP